LSRTTTCTVSHPLLSLKTRLAGKAGLVTRKFAFVKAGRGLVRGRGRNLAERARPAYNQ
jgi:hypothetical protein